MLKSLELNGFKSFGKKTSLVFDTPVTAIVGPNGSGKSNIVESIRFVLGEQSMKSLRGKGGTDLIFKGSKTLSAGHKARVTITFDNRKKVFSFTTSDNQSANLDFDEVSFSREVTSDGGSTYYINDTEVRLKDVTEALASVNIGSSGHHIISQGEADRILSANAKDRRAMVEDALGLKIYQYKIKESERKLEKTTVNMKEAESLRREIAPHLAFLKKQVEKIERARDMRVELEGLYETYVAAERGYLLQSREMLAVKQKNCETELLNIEERLVQYQANRSDDPVLAQKQTTLHEKEKTQGMIRATHEELARKIGRIEGSLETLESIQGTPEAEGEISVSFREIETMAEGIGQVLDEASRASTLESIFPMLSRIKSELWNFLEEKRRSVERAPENQNRSHEAEIEALRATRAQIVTELDAISASERTLASEIETIRREMASLLLLKQESDRAYYELSGKKSEVLGVRNVLAVEGERLSEEEMRFEEEMREAAALIGAHVAAVSPSRDPKVLTADVRMEQEATHKKIERIKIKLEDIGGGSGSDTLKEYEETVARDLFLSRELQDIKESLDSLRALISELKDTLDTKFKEGIEKINTEFQEFFRLMFGGGTAFLSIVVEHKRPSKDGEEDEEEMPDDPDEVLAFERGIDINVSLPQKKVKDLHMLSGGERSLTSIALLFAMSQVNPPPFLVLDETDAALDEANSRKYGDMLKNLSQYSQLLVVTHNRETMSRAQVLYGITVGAEGASKLLSIKLEEAVEIAK